MCLLLTLGVYHVYHGHRKHNWLQQQIVKMSCETELKHLRAIVTEHGGRDNFAACVRAFHDVEARLETMSWSSADTDCVQRVRSEIAGLPEVMPSKLITTTPISFKKNVSRVQQEPRDGESR
jgi:hypothetical protein